ncbi:hypothetical protein [Bacillus sp. T33-2]|nr:hypothetical protein [Bacillus sp. T33-2]
MTYVLGSVAYRNKKERDRLWRELRKELGGNALLWAEDGFILYKYSEF